MKIKNNTLSRELNTVNGFTVCIFAAVSLVFAIVTLIFGTDSDVYCKYVFPKLFVSMFCYSLVFIVHMTVLGAYVGIGMGEYGCMKREETAVYGIVALICEAAAIPLSFQTKAFFYAFLLLMSSFCFFLLLAFKGNRNGILSAVLAVLCGAGFLYQIYISFSLMLLN